MSKKYTKLRDEFIRKEAERDTMVNIFNKDFNEKHSDLYEANEDALNEILINQIDISNANFDLGYANGKCNAYTEGLKDGIKYVAVGGVIGLTIGAIYENRKQIKEYGKYIKNKIFKKKDDAITFDENGNIIQ